MVKSYDAVVIGAGLGGLSAATFLARNGKSVLLLERHNIPGGYATTFCRGRFEFDISLHVLSGIGTQAAPGGLYNYLDYLGVAKKMKFLPTHELFRVADDTMDLTVPTGRDKCQEYYMQNFPKQAAQIEKYFETLKDFMTEFNGVIAAASTRTSDLSLDKFPNFVKYGMKTYGEVVDQIITDETLKAALSPYWGYIGLPPSKVPFHLMASVWDIFLKDSSYHIRGRCQALSNAFIETLYEHGGEVKFSCGAKKIVTKDGKVTGVITDDDEEVKAGVVVSNANPLFTMVNLIGIENAPRKYMQDLNSRMPGFSTVNVFVGLDCPPEAIGATAHENFLNFSRDVDAVWERAFTLSPPEGILVTNYNVTDPDFSPPGTSVMAMIAGSYARPWYLLPPEQYVDAKNAFARRMLDIAEKYYPGLRDHIEVIEVATPITNMRYSGNPGGAIYGFESILSDSGILRIRHNTPIDGLFFASAWTIPGGGYQPSISSGSIAGGRALKKLS